jgi:hypothetical protein
LEREAAKAGLKTNKQNTKYIIAARNDRTIRDVEQSVAIGDKLFEVVKESLMTPTNDVSLEIQRRIQTANRCHFSRQTKLTIYKTLIRPVLFCGSETWVLTKRKTNCSYLRGTICGPKIENGVYRRRYNHELDREFESSMP